MFLNRNRLTVRSAVPDDRLAVTGLVRREQRVHIHLDWRPVEDWLGHPPFWLVERNHGLQGALACPPGPPDIAWLRLFGIVNGADAQQLWNLLWPQALTELQTLAASSAAALSIDTWIDPLLRGAQFVRTHAVVVLERLRTRTLLQLAPPPAIRIRPATPADAPTIIATDTRAFEPPWQLSTDMLETAMRQADYLTVAETSAGDIIGYQLTTASAHGGAHLGRLAVLPQWQGRGLGAAIAADMLDHYQQRGWSHITVNTQDSNRASLRVYQRLGFELTGEEFPVYQRTL